MSDELITALRKEAGRLGRLQSDKEHQTNQRRKTFRYRNHILTQAADRIAELEKQVDAVREWNKFYGALLREEYPVAYDELQQALQEKSDG